MPPKFKKEYEGSREPERQALLDFASDEDDFFLRGPNAQPDRLLGKSRTSDPKLSRLQNQVDEVIDVMQDNIGRVIDRGECLEDLQDKSEDLSSNADTFRIRAKGLRNKMWWKQCKV
ncbi:hypothetical protein LSH36_246g02054 [Paralvinella palmiformis]|uniref:V-SNARE coiled-coil homology domain-containing protein n=1 Tax=Paralvinella palmiformis TaxID=53620 RepID=A0AAD9JMH8_9ANNE|nr:hypothetical protein LSH36_246g02054 [Paralvinella palmiformis]